MKKLPLFILVAIPVLVFLQSLPFKFSGAIETVYIFDTIGAWINSLGLPALAATFASYGAYGVGAAELIASILLLLPATRHWGALFGLGVLSGAIFFHVFTPLGIAVEFPGAKPGGDPLLFYMAVISWLCLLTLAIMHRDRYPFIGSNKNDLI